MPQLHSIVTTVGRNKHIAKIAENAAIVFTEIALGDGAAYPSGGETELNNEIHRGLITGSGVEPGEPDAVWFDLYVPADVDTFHAQEIGLFDEDGILYAVSRYETPVPKFGPDSANLSDNTFRIIVVFSDTENILVTLSPVTGLTAETLTAHLPWATDEEAAEPTTDDRIIEVYQVHDLLNDQDLSKSAPIVLLHETRIGNASPYSLADDFSDKRKFNTVVTDQIGVTLVDFQIGLPAGVYRVEATAQGFDAGHHRARLYDVTNDAVLLLGTSCDSYPGVVTTSMMVGHIVLAAPTIIELQHKSEPSGTRLSGDDNNILPDAHMDAYILITREKSL